MPESPYNMNEILNFDTTVTSTQLHESQLNSTIGPELNLASSKTAFKKTNAPSHSDSMDSAEPEVEKWATPEVIQRIGKEFGKENSLNVLLNSTKLDSPLILSSVQFRKIVK